MEPQAYLDFLDPLDIRIKGHRIGIDDVLYYYLKGYRPEAIREQYPSLSLEEIEAAIAYYQCNQAQMDQYLDDQAAWAEERRQRLMADEPPVVKRIREIVQARRADSPSNSD